MIKLPVGLGAIRIGGGGFNRGGWGRGFSRVSWPAYYQQPVYYQQPLVYQQPVYYQQPVQQVQQQQIVSAPFCVTRPNTIPKCYGTMSWGNDGNTVCCNS